MKSRTEPQSERRRSRGCRAGAAQFAVPNDPNELNPGIVPEKFFLAANRLGGDEKSVNFLSMNSFRAVMLIKPFQLAVCVVRGLRA